MAEVIRKSLDAPEEVIIFPKITASLVELGDLTVGLFVSEPGWRWSEHNRPRVGGEWCQARHIGVIIS
jgi:DNA topoisomerase VI subunit B